MAEPARAENLTPIRADDTQARARAKLYRIAEAAAAKVIADLEALANDETAKMADRMSARRLLVHAAAELGRAQVKWSGASPRPAVAPAGDAPDPPAPRGLPSR